MPEATEVSSSIQFRRFIEGNWNSIEVSLHQPGIHWNTTTNIKEDQEPRLVQGIQHQSHNEEGCEGCHGWDHLNNQEEDQTLFTRQEIVTAVCVTCEGNDTCLYNHGDNGDNQGVHIPSAIMSFREKF